MFQGVQLYCCCNETIEIFGVGQILVMMAGQAENIWSDCWLWKNLVLKFQAKICVRSAQTEYRMIIECLHFLFYVILSVKNGRYCFHFNFSTLFQVTSICVFINMYILWWLFDNYWSHWMFMVSRITSYLIIGYK